MELNSKKAQVAWNDYKGFLNGLGVRLELNPGIEQAFKIGYAKGEAENQTAIEKLPPMDGTPADQVIKSRNHFKVSRRSDAERVRDARLVARILKQSGQEMRLQYITDAINTLGAEWPLKNASRYIALAAEVYPEIKKVGYGVYVYKK